MESQAYRVTSEGTCQKVSVQSGVYLSGIFLAQFMLHLFGKVIVSSYIKLPFVNLNSYLPLFRIFMFYVSSIFMPGSYFE